MARCLSHGVAAADALSEAGTYHVELEEVSKRAMDFGGLRRSRRKALPGDYRFFPIKQHIGFYPKGCGKNDKNT